MVTTGGRVWNRFKNELGGHNGCRIVVNHLIDRGHDPVGHQFLDDINRADTHLFCQIADVNAYGNFDLFLAHKDTSSNKMRPAPARMPDGCHVSDQPFTLSSIHQAFQTSAPVWGPAESSDRLEMNSSSRCRSSVVNTVFKAFASPPFKARSQHNLLL
jgi:hypothetical protein